VLTLGCAPIVIAYPPPSPLAHTAEPLPAHTAEVGVGGTSLTITGANGIGWVPNFYGGTLMAQAGWGLSDRFDVRLTGSTHLQGPTGGLQLGYQALVRERWSLGFTSAFNASVARGSFSETVTAVDAGGDVLYDENGDPYQETVTTEYGYTSFAPSTGLRASWRAWPRITFTGAARVSYSITRATSGLRQEMPRQLWIETWTGVTWGRPSGVMVSAGFHYMPWPLGRVGPNPLLSIGYRADLKGE
jgi:hypothetical protein